MVEWAEPILQSKSPPTAIVQKRETIKAAENMLRKGRAMQEGDFPA